MSAPCIDSGVLERLRAAVGPGGTLEGADTEPYARDWRDYFRGATPLVLRPACTEEVAAIVRICAETGTALVPQGGNTGMVGGATPSPDGHEVVLSLARMNAIRNVDPLDYTMTVEAGCVLADVQAAAREADRLFPLSLAAEGSCQIGGNLATNAGGTAVLRYGNARDLVLGLEVVLPDGSVWDGLRGLRKDNTGYDLKQLFLGAEGSLGVITAAVLKLYPLPAERCTAMVAVADPHAATRLLADLRTATGDGVTTFEYMHRACLELVFEHVPGTTDPFESVHEHYALVELTSGRRGSDQRAALEDALAAAFDDGRVRDAVIADSEAQADRLWQLRETIPEANNRTGGCIRHDVSVAVSRVAEFLERGSRLARETIEGVRVTPFGHLGDGNIHFNMVGAPGSDGAEFLARAGEITPRIHALAMEMGGSFSAEHGIGQYKKAELQRYRSAVELRLMRMLKDSLDPAGIMNPGKVL